MGSRRCSILDSTAGLENLAVPCSEFVIREYPRRLVETRRT